MLYKHKQLKQKTNDSPNNKNTYYILKISSLKIISYLLFLFHYIYIKALSKIFYIIYFVQTILHHVTYHIFNIEYLFSGL